MCNDSIPKSQKSRKYARNSDKEKGPTFCGDGMRLLVDKNVRNIEVNGDGCKVTVATNIGNIRINGDGCRLRIEMNKGTVEYHGDGGRISLGTESTETKVDYVGDGGRVDVVEATKWINLVRRESTSTKPVERKNHHRTWGSLCSCHHSNDCDAPVDNRQKRIVRKTFKTVSYVYDESPKIVSQTKRCRGNVNVVNSSTIAT